MDDLGHCFLINKCELYIAVGKKKMAHAWWSFYGLYMGEREKNTKINVTFSLSGWAMPFLQRRPGLWQMLRLSPRTESPRSVCLAEAGEGKHSGHSCRLLLSAASLGPQTPVTRAGQGNSEPTPPRPAPPPWKRGQIAAHPEHTRC